MCPHHTKYENLVDWISKRDSMLVAYSGGVDSTLLASVGRSVLGARCAVVFANGDSTPETERDHARSLASTLGLDLIEVETSELADPRFAANPTDRCYWCKTELFDMLRSIATSGGFEVIVDGSNVDDSVDFRPGRKACAEYGVLSPLAESGFTKADIRALARELELPNWDKPSMACLASRFPYGQPITEEGLARVAAAETALAGLGLTQCRVRSHGDVARLEVAPGEMSRAWELRERVSEALHKAGFAWASLDLDGYRTGSMNATLSEAERITRS